MKHLAIDLGSSNAKFYLAEIEEGTIDVNEIHRFAIPRMYICGHLRTDLYRIYREILDVLIRLKKDDIRIDSMGVDTWASDFAILDGSGEMIGLPVFYRDERSVWAPEHVEQTMTLRKLYALTNQRRMRDSSFSQLLAVKREQPEQLNDAHTFLCIGDLLMYFFTGKAVSEASAASYTQLYSNKNNVWSEEVLDYYGIPKGMMPEVCHAGDVLGVIRKDLQEKYALDPIKVIAPAVHDTACSIASIPADMSKKWAYICTGTWFLTGVETDGYCDHMDEDLAFANDCSYTDMALGKKMLKQNVSGMWVIQECKKAWEASGNPVTFPEIVTLAKMAQPFYALVDTDDPALFSPEDMPRAVCDYLKSTGQPGLKENDIGQMARVIYESIAIKCRRSIDTIAAICKEEFEEIYIAGGASEIDFLNDMIASALGKPLKAGPKEASSLGNAMLQHYGCGGVSSLEEIRRMTAATVSKKIWLPKETAVWEEQYRKFLSITG